MLISVYFVLMFAHPLPNPAPMSVKAGQRGRERPDAAAARRPPARVPRNARRSITVYLRRRAASSLYLRPLASLSIAVLANRAKGQWPLLVKTRWCVSNYDHTVISFETAGQIGDAIEDLARARFDPVVWNAVKRLDAIHRPYIRPTIRWALIRKLPFVADVPQWNHNRTCCRSRRGT